MKNKLFLLGVLFLLFPVGGRTFPLQSAFEKGKIIDKVVCQHFPSQSYALYLPQEYTPDKSWPILFAFDPSARGKVPVEHFKEAAEEYGIIVVGSNNIKNGPWEEIFQAMQIIWDDTENRFNIDKKSIYSTGFSGGARAAVIFSQTINKPVAGIIGCGAGIPVGFKLDEMNPSVYYGTVGIADFNYREMVMLDKQLDQAGIKHYIHFFEGTHSWPPSDVCLSALEWMEIMRMKQDVIPRDNEEIEKVYKKKIHTAENLEAQGKIYWAVLSYQGISSLFSGLRDISGIEEKINRLEESEPYKQFVRDENERQKREASIIRTCGNIFNNIEKTPQDYNDFEELFTKMELDYLLEEAQAESRLEDQSLAVRLLHLIFVRAAQTGNQHLKNNQPSKAVILFEIAVKASQGNEDVYKLVLFDLAQAYALNKDKKSALEYLDLAVKNNFNDLSAVQNSPYFDDLKESRKYKDILEKIRKKQ